MVVVVRKVRVCALDDTYGILLDWNIATIVVLLQSESLDSLVNS